MRKSGILMHISSLPSDYGIGTMGKEAYKFVDFLKSAKQVEDKSQVIKKHINNSKMEISFQ